MYCLTLRLYQLVFLRVAVYFKRSEIEEPKKIMSTMYFSQGGTCWEWRQKYLWSISILLL